MAITTRHSQRVAVTFRGIFHMVLHPDLGSRKMGIETRAVPGEHFEC
ncbi:MAG: hypothetical protein ACNA8L_08435 [Luteolibacter sp.]|jgi:hypothetical protein